RRYVDQRSAGSDSPGDLFMALRYLEDARELARRTEDCPPLLLANVNNALGLIHNVQLQFTVAVERFSQAERICREQDASASHAEVLENLILALIEIGRYDDARSRCAELEALGGAAADPRTLAALGVAYLKLGDHSQATERFDLARHLARNDADCRNDLSFMVELASNAAACAQAVGAYDEAERFLMEAQRELESGGVEPRLAAVVRGNLGRMYLTLERLDEAEVQLEAVLAVLRELQGPQHPDTLLLLLDLANLARARGYHAEARERCEEALRGLIAVRGKGHPLVARARMEMAALSRDQGRCTEAMDQATKALELLDARLGKNHKESVLACLKATLIAADCRESDAQATAFHMLTVEAGRRFAQLRTALGPKNVEVLRAMVYFADVGAQTPTAYATALQRYRTAEEGFLELYGDGAKSLAALRLKQGRLLERMEQPEEALRTYDRALRRLDRSLAGHPIQAELLGAMGDAHERLGQPERAAERWRDALRILMATYGADHPRVRRFKEQRGQ
ncbi:MAG: tetratricopeptide repeat-containing protein, partial [Planctomycetes bacterium]|nr:tetratricopeptide repeat-containing protein [Planctomycetota bacterium]